MIQFYEQRNWHEPKPYPEHCCNCECASENVELALILTSTNLLETLEALRMSVELLQFLFHRSGIFLVDEVSVVPIFCHETMTAMSKMCCKCEMWIYLTIRATFSKLRML